MRRHRQQQQASYFPLILLGIAIVLAVVFIWRYTYTPSGEAKSTEIITQDIPFAVRLGEAENASYSIISGLTSLNEGEALETKALPGVQLRFFEGTTVTLDAQTELVLTTVQQKEEDAQMLLTLKKGRLWLDVTKKSGEESFFRVETGGTTFESDEGVFSVSQEEIYAMRGMATITRDGSVLQLSPWQSLRLGAMGYEAGPLDPDTNWYKQNTARGRGEEVTFTTEETNEETEDEEEISPEETNSPVQITTPGKNGEEVEATLDDEGIVEIRGTVPEGTTKVTVTHKNAEPYELSGFSEGDATFLYKASTTYDNLDPGENLYTIRASVGETVEMASITLVYGAEDEEEAADDDEEVPEEPTAETKEITFLAPEAGASITEDEVLVRGEAPAGAEKVTVIHPSLGTYTLSGFGAGDRSWQYRIRSDIGNRDEGEITLKVRIYGDAGVLLAAGELSFTLEPLEEDEEENPDDGNANDVMEIDLSEPVPANPDGSPTI